MHVCVRALEHISVFTLAFHTPLPLLLLSPRLDSIICFHFFPHIYFFANLARSLFFVATKRIHAQARDIAINNSAPCTGSTKKSSLYFYHQTALEEGLNLFIPFWWARLARLWTIFVLNISTTRWLHGATHSGRIIPTYFQRSSAFHFLLFFYPSIAFDFLFAISYNHLANSLHFIAAFSQQQ